MLVTMDDEPMSMDDDEQALFNALTSQNAVDRGWVLATAIASALPIVGGPAGVLADYLNRRTDTKVVGFVVKLASCYRTMRRDVNTLEEKYMSEFADRLVVVIDEATQARNRRKREAYLSAGLSIGTSARPEDDEFDLMIATLGRLEAVHIRLLARLGETGDVEDAKAMWKRIGEVTPELDEIVLWRLWDDLESEGLVPGRSALVVESSPDEPDERGSTPLTSFGDRFLEFISAGGFGGSEATAGSYGSPS